ncbi:MAG: carotenoid 1,2-hydratase, partial [Pseudomonadota bacterium]
MPQPMFPAPPAPSRRKALVLGMAGAMGAAAWSSQTQALPARTLSFPRDHGSHPELRTEWWYITGHAQANGRDWGFQVTFFRSRVDAAQGIQSAFAAKHLLFAHAALTDLKGQRLHHDQRIARAGFGVAQASESDTAIRLQDWSLVRSDLPGGGVSRYAARIQGEHFGLQLQFDATQPVLLQGREGLSRKGPESTQASYYYSQPQLAVGGAIVLDGKRTAIDPGSGRAWMDHEWSEALMHPEARGWDWIGMNLLDGSALTAFHLRREDGSALWGGGSFRAPGQAAARIFDAGEVVFTAQRWWTSPVSGARYPVQWRVQTPVGVFEVRSLLDSQELDSSASTGAIYWEGLSELVRDGRVVGKGYLEMTG